MQYGIQKKGPACYCAGDDPPCCGGGGGGAEKGFMLPTLHQQASVSIW